MTGPRVVIDAVRKRAEKGFRTELGVLKVVLNAEQRGEVARLLGTSWDVSGRPIRLQEFAESLGEHGLNVREFIEILDGKPVVERREQRAQEQVAMDAERSAAAAVLADAGIDASCAWAWLNDPSLPRGGSDDLLPLAVRAAGVWQQLPGNTDSGVRLAQLAASALNDAHALDFREELGRAVGRLIALSHDLPRPLRAGRDWRRAWAAAGVLCDEVSSRVLTLNLPLSGDAPAARWSAAAPGEPLWLTLRSIGGDWSIAPGTKVFVCENPTVVESAADTLGVRCPPMICTDGIPTVAALDLVARLAEGGGRITVRADIDAAGFTVVDQVRSVAPDAVGWRFDVATYARYADLAAVPRISSDLTGDARQLREVFAQHRVPLHEETLLDQLLQDLSGAASSPVATEATSL